MNYRAPLDPECPHVVAYMAALFGDPTPARGAPTDEICEDFAPPAPPIVRTMPLLWAREYRSRALICTAPERSRAVLSLLRGPNNQADHDGHDRDQQYPKSLARA
jgi:hypothetical protein